MSKDNATRFGFVALIGAPNAGKSTLTNRLVGAKVSIVTHKVQTTRTRVLGIVIEGDTQIAIVDTPGIFQPKRRLDRAMVRAAWDGASEAEAVVLLVDAGSGITDEVRAILDGLKKSGRKVMLALNKVDSIRKEKLLELATELDATGLFTDIFMISALKGDGVEDLLAHLVKQMPEGPWMFPEEQLSDMPQRLLAAEVTREKLFLQVHEELPYMLTVETESWEERPDGSVRIEQTIYVPRENHRAIILGKGGQKIKTIGAAARKELEEMLECRVHLFLFVKVRDRWEEDPQRYSVWNLDFNS